MSLFSLRSGALALGLALMIASLPGCTTAEGAPFTDLQHISSGAPQGYEELGPVFCEEWTVCFFNCLSTQGDLLGNVADQAMAQTQVLGGDVLLRANCRVETRTFMLPFGIPFILGVQEYQVSGIAARKKSLAQ